MFVRVSLVAFFVGVSSAAFAQEQLTGVVRDGSGAVVTGATIVVRQTSSPFERLVDSGRDGRFVLTPLADGDYTLEVIAPGFAMQQVTARVPSVAPIELVLVTGAGRRGRADRLGVPSGGAARKPQHQCGGVIAAAHGRKRVADGRGVAARSARGAVAPRLGNRRCRRRADPGNRFAAGAGADGRPAAARRAAASSAAWSTSIASRSIVSSRWKSSRAPRRRSMVPMRSAA